MFDYRVVAVDPGGTTGVAWNVGMYELDAMQLGDPKHHRTLYELLSYFEPHVIVCERFEHRQGKFRSGLDLRAREYIGVCELYAQNTFTEIVMQNPMRHDRGLWNDEMLRRAKQLVEPASRNPHANDAKRHLLYFVTESGRFKEWREHWLRKARK